MFHDILGIYDDCRQMKHAKRYALIGEIIRGAVGDYVKEVEQREFPTAEQSFEAEAGLLAELRQA